MKVCFCSRKVLMFGFFCGSYTYDPSLEIAFELGLIGC